MNHAKDEFFEIVMTQLQLGLTFDDVRLDTDYSDITLEEISLETRFSRNIPLRIPFVSAAMDTVTEHELAIELAMLGGLGILHRNNTPKEQAKEVARVKHHLHGMIFKPVCVKQSDTIQAVLNMRQEKGYSFSSFPVLNSENGYLVGVITGNDFDLCLDSNQLVEDVMSKKLVTVVSDTNLEDVFRVMQESHRKVIPVVDEDRKVLGLYVLSDVKRIKTGAAQQYNTDSRNQLRVGAAIGVGKEAIERANVLHGENVDVLVIDKAHADTKEVIDTLQELKAAWPDLDVVVGNISNGRSAQRLIRAGADGLKVGQGPGSICTTQVVTGIGAPQVTATYDCAFAAEKHDIPICTDGGLRYSGDITIALAAGADCIMLGNMFAGAKETPGTIVSSQGRQWKSYRGMGSLGALQENLGSRDRYNQLDVTTIVPQGIEGMVRYKGPLAALVHQYVGGIKGGMFDIGVASIKELQEKAMFIRISSAGNRESHPHDVQITKDAPNYQQR